MRRASAKRYSIESCKESRECEAESAKRRVQVRSGPSSLCSGLGGEPATSLSARAGSPIRASRVRNCRFLQLLTLPTTPLPPRNLFDGVRVTSPAPAAIAGGPDDAPAGGNKSRRQNLLSWLAQLELPCLLASSLPPPPRDPNRQAPPRLRRRAVVAAAGRVRV